MKEKNGKKRADMERIPPELAAKAKAGDQAAFTELYQRTSGMLYRTIRSMIQDEDQVWDVLQDSYLRAWRGLDKLETDEAFLPWLRRIAVNTAANALAKRVPLTFTELAGEEDDPEPEVPDLNPDTQPELALDRQESARLVRELLEELSPAQQAVMGMRYYEDMPVKDIAALLQVSQSTVKNQLLRGRKRIEAGVRALEKRGVKLYGLSPLPFLLALLRRLEPGQAAEQKALAAVLAEAPAAGGTAAVTVTAMTAGQAFLHGLGAKLLAGALAVVVLIGGGKLAHDALKKNNDPPVGPELPSITEPVDPDETFELLETEPTEDATPTDSPESLVTEPSEPPAEPTVLASGRFGLRQRERQSDPNAVLPYFTAIDPDAEDRIYTNNAVEIRYDGVGVRQRELPDGEERLLFSLERTAENNYYLFGVTENRLYFSCHNPDPEVWWGLTVFSVNYQGGDRQELGSLWDPYFGDGWVVLRSFASDVRPNSAKIFNRNDELVVEEPKERVWAVAAVDGSLYRIHVKEYPKEGGDSEWSEELIRQDPDGTQTVLMQFPVSGDYDGYGIEANIYNGVICFGDPSGDLYDLYTLEALEDRYDSSFYDDSLTWTLDSAGVLTVSGSGVMGSCLPQPWLDYQETITAVVLEDGVTNIGAYAFSGCTILTSVSIPDSVTDLGTGVFDECRDLTDVTLPAGLTEIPDNLFFGCSSLETVVIPEGVTAIGNYAFNRCDALSNVSIPAGVTSVGEHAFWRCPSLTSVTVPASVTSIGEEAFGWDYVYNGHDIEAQRVVGFTIYGAAGSAAQTYAEENGFQFVKVN